MTQDLILDAITGYLTVLNYETMLEANKKNFESVSKHLEEIKTKFDLGSATLYDLQTAQSSYAIAETNLFSAKQNLLLGKKSFQRISGLKPKNLEQVINISYKLNLESLENNALKNNLSLLLLKNDIESKKILLLKEKKTKKPNLDITGVAQYSDSDRIDTGTETTKSSIALTLTIPIFQQGIDNSNIRKYYSQILQSELLLEDTKQDLLITISNDYKNFIVNNSIMNSNNISIEASETALNSLIQEYEIGTKSISDILLEEEKLLISKVNLSTARKDFLISYFKLKYLEGSLIDDFKEYLPEFE